MMLWYTIGTPLVHQHNMKKPAAHRHDKVISTKHTPGQLRRLKELAAQAKVGVCSYASRVLHAHLEASQPIKPMPAPPATLPPQRQTEDDEVLYPNSDLVAAGKRLAVAVEAASLEYRKHICWYGWTDGLPERGDRYLAFDAAWMASDYKLAETLARDAKAEHRRR